MQPLMVIIPDRLSDLVAKGEVTPRYYNPGNLFREVHIVLTNDDAPDLRCIQPMFGDAKVTVHNIIPPPRHFTKTAGWHPWLTKGIEASAVKLARKIRPSIVRSYGSEVVLCLARAVQEQLSIPWAASLHNNLDCRVFTTGALNKLRRNRDIAISKRSLPHAGAVLPVYPAITPFLEGIGVKNAVVCRNVLSADITRKTSYGIVGTGKLLSVGRLIPGKNPINFIKAIDGLDADLTIIGNGPLADAAKQCGGRVKFIPSMSNADICRSLHNYDLFLSNCDYPGIPKAVMEAMLAGLPIITNFPRSIIGSDMSDPEAFARVDDSPQSYRFVIQSLLKNHKLRERRGRSAAAYADARWSPADAEAKVTAIYSSLATGRSTPRTRSAA